MKNEKYGRFVKFMDWLVSLPVPYASFTLGLTLILWLGFIGILIQFNPLNEKNGAEATLQLVFFCFALGAAAPVFPFPGLQAKLPLVVGLAVLGGAGLLAGYGIIGMFLFAVESATMFGAVIYNLSLLAISLSISILSMESLAAAFRSASSKMSANTSH